MFLIILDAGKDSLIQVKNSLYLCNPECNTFFHSKCLFVCPVLICTNGKIFVSRGNRGRLGRFSYTLRLLPRYLTEVFKSLHRDHQCRWVQGQYINDFTPCTISALDQKL